jgi:DNA-binding MarR family transcriptional regulator
MPRGTATQRPSPVPGGKGPEASRSDDLTRLLRYSHIFASTIRDTLECGILEDISPLPLTVTQFLVLKLMSRDGQHRAGEVARYMGISRPAATKNIDKLVRHGLIVRRRSHGDRRATLLSVSPRGRKLVQRYEETKRDRMQPLVDRFTDSDVEQLTALLRRISIAILRTAPRQDRSCLRCGAYLEQDCPIGPLQGGCPHQDLQDGRHAGDRIGGMA